MWQIIKKTRSAKRIRKTLLIPLALLVSLFPSPLSALDETFYSGNDILFYNPEVSCSPTSTTSSITSTGGTSGDITVAQANIKQHSEDVAFLAEKKPDFITLQETGQRTVDQLKVAGYEGFRDSSFYKSNPATNQAKSTAILWRSDWTKIEAGREIIVPTQGPQKWDMGRAITWGVFKDSKGGTTSVISLHHMINPNKSPGSPPNIQLRRQLYAEGMDIVASKVQELSTLGPVIAGGDFNFQIGDDNDYGPRKKLAAVNMQSTHDSLGRLENTAVDYIFYTKNMTAKSHTSVAKGQGNNHSDHPYIFATLSADGSGGGDISVTGETGDCTCSATTSSLTLSGSDNEERAFRFFTQKGYSPQQAAGIVGNMKAESGVQPMRLQNTKSGVETSSRDINLSGLGWGIVQWTPPSKMVNPSLSKSRTHEEIDSLAYQLEFLWGQLTNTGVGAATSEKGAGDDLKSQTTIDGSARSFMLKFERPKDQSESAQKGRVQLANEVFGKFGTSGDTVAATPTITGTSSTSCGDSALQGSGDVVAIAQAELAKNVIEDPVGCDSANSSAVGSCGAEIDKYTDKHLEYWCADFVSWVYKEAGTPFTGGSSGGWRIPGVSDVQAWFEEHATWTKNGSGITPQPGDVYTMGISHTGIVEKVEGNTVYTISGNTSVDNTGNGRGVGRGQYPIGSPSILGYGRL